MMFSSVAAEVRVFPSLTIPAPVAYRIAMDRQQPRYSGDCHHSANRLADQQMEAEHVISGKLTLSLIWALSFRSFWQLQLLRLVLPLQ